MTVFRWIQPAICVVAAVAMAAAARADEVNDYPTNARME